QERLEIEGSFPRIIEGICQGFSNLKSYYQGLNTQCEGNEVNIDSISENFTNFDALIAQLITKMQDFNEAMAVANEAHQTVRERVEEYGIAAYLAYQAYPDDQSYQDEANTAYAAWMAAGTAAMAADGNLDNIKNDFFGIITDGLTPLINNINASFIQATQPKPPTEPPTDPDNTYTYDAGRVFYYSNIFNEMLKGYISVEDEKFNDATWIHDQIKNGNIHMEEYSESANGGQGGFVETSIAQDSSLYEESYEKNNAAAQAEYDRLISDLNYKEKQLDMKLNTINTEYNAAKEEYESVKKTQEKSIDRTFKIFG
ncbi:MAG TPA: hypothetical protein PKI94_04185, partial [Candidatus Gastranaerophilaceae bacterium]|nr:hypothetical protein [Candidatus Gastranaerophilaceae bacterium]